MKPKPLYGEVRFHLGAGKHYMHWQIKVKQGADTIEVIYYNPSEYQLELRGCKLVNKVNKAKQVFEAGVHDVSGWVKCDEVMLRQTFFPKLPIDSLEKVYYNPVRNPYWRRESDCGEFIWDNYEFDTLLTDGKQVYILEERT